MKFGVLLPTLDSRAASASELIEMARIVESLGFDSMWVPDHVAAPHGDGTDRGAHSGYEALVMVSALAACTKRVQIGTAVLALPFRHPAITAKMLAAADLLSGGRVVLGVGVGANRNEFAALGLPESHFERRGQLSDEYIRAIKEMWMSTGPSGFNGEFVTFADVGTFPKPHQKPHPPIVIAGEGTAAMQRASRHGNGYMCISLTPEALTERTAQLGALCQKDRRDPRELEVFMLARLNVTDAPTGDDRRPLSGSADQVWSDLRAYARAGLDHLIIIPDASSASEAEPMLERVASQIVAGFARVREARP